MSGHAGMSTQLVPPTAGLTLAVSGRSVRGDRLHSQAQDWEMTNIVQQMAAARQLKCVSGTQERQHAFALVYAFARKNESCKS